MTSLSDFLKCKKVRCIESNKSHGLKKGEIYDVISTEYTKLGFGEWLHIRISKDGEKNSYLSGFFEPVLETAIQATDSLDSTPMGTRTINCPRFEIGQKVYAPWLNDGDILTLSLDDNDDLSAMTKEGLQAFDCEGYAQNYTPRQPDLFHATQENYELLSKLMPWADFELPSKELTGSDLCRAMLDKGWKYVPCYVSNNSDEFAIIGSLSELIIATDADRTKEFVGDDVWNYAVPFDLKTGEPLTEAVLQNA